MTGMKVVFFALAIHLGSGKNVRDLTGHYRGEGTHTHIHDAHSDIDAHVSHGVFDPSSIQFNTAPLPVLVPLQVEPLIPPQQPPSFSPLPPQIAHLTPLTPNEEFFEPRCGCVIKGHCQQTLEAKIYGAKSTLVCGREEFERCCYPEDPWPGYTDLYANIVPCVPQEDCIRKYGDFATDVRDYGTIPPCPGLGAVRCTDKIPALGGVQTIPHINEPVQYSIPILPQRPLNLPSLTPQLPAVFSGPTEFEQIPSVPEQPPVQGPIQIPTTFIQTQSPNQEPGGYVFPTPNFPNFPQTAFNYNLPVTQDTLTPTPLVGTPEVAPVGGPIEPYSPYIPPYGYGYGGVPGYGWISPFGQFSVYKSPYGISVRKSFGKFFG